MKNIFSVNHCWAGKQKDKASFSLADRAFVFCPQSMTPPVFHHTPSFSPPPPVRDFHRIYTKMEGSRSGHLVVKAKLHNVPR